MDKIQLPVFNWQKRPWLYFVFNWGSPVYCSENLLACVEYSRRTASGWGNTIPEGALKCIGYRPGGEPGLDLDELDLTQVVLKCISHD